MPEYRRLTRFEPVTGVPQPVEMTWSFPFIDQTGGFGVLFYPAFFRNELPPLKTAQVWSDLRDSQRPRHHDRLRSELSAAYGAVELSSGFGQRNVLLMGAAISAWVYQARAMVHVPSESAETHTATNAFYLFLGQPWDQLAVLTGTGLYGFELASVRKD